MGLVFLCCLLHISNNVLLCHALSLLCVCMCLRSVVVQALGVVCSIWFGRFRSVIRLWLGCGRSGMVCLLASVFLYDPACELSEPKELFSDLW